MKCNRRSLNALASWFRGWTPVRAFTGDLGKWGTRVNIRALFSCLEISFVRILAESYGKENLVNVCNEGADLWSPSLGPRAFGEHNLIAELGTDFPYKFQCLRPVSFWQENLWRNCRIWTWIAHRPLEGADLDDEPKLSRVQRPHYSIANLEGIGPVVSCKKCFEENDRFGGSISYSPFKEGGSWWEHNQRRYHCHDASYQKWFQSDWSLRGQFLGPFLEPPWGPLLGAIDMSKI